MVHSSFVVEGQWQFNQQTQGFWISQALLSCLSPGAEELSFKAFLALLLPASSQILRDWLGQSDPVSGDLVLYFEGFSVPSRCRLEKMRGKQSDSVFSAYLKPVDQAQESADRNFTLQRGLRIYEAASVGAVFFNQQQEIVACNPHFRHLWQMDQGTQRLEMDAENRAQFQDLLQQARFWCRFEKTIPLAEASRTLDILMIPVPTVEAGLFMGIVTDISERKAREVEWAKRAEILESFFLNAPIPMGVVEVASDQVRHLMDNRQTQRLLKRSAEQLEGQVMTDLGASPDLQALWLDAYQRAGQLQRPVSFVYDQLLNDKVYWFDATVAVVNAAENRFCYLSQDITERRRQQELLQSQNLSLNHFQLQLQQLNRIGFDTSQTSQEQLQAAMSLVRDYLDLQRVEIYQAHALLSDGEPLSLEISDAQYQDWLQEEAVLTHGVEWPEDELPDQQVNAPVVCAVFPFSLSNLVEKVQGLLILYPRTATCLNDYHLQFVKITLCWIESMLEHQARLDHLLSLNKNSEQSLNILSHDLRNSLTSVIGLSQLLKRREWVYEPGLDLLERVHQAGKNAHKLLQEMLALQELEAGEQGEHLYRLDLSTLVKQVVQSFTVQAREQDLTLEFQVPEGIVQLPLHKNWFRRIIDNLLGNALKFTPPGGRILLKIEKHKQELLITVADNGIGIPKDLHQHIFKRFSSARRNGVNGEGSTGLGLYLVHQIVALHHGSIGFESEPDQGTRFWIRMPLK